MSKTNRKAAKWGSFPEFQVQKQSTDPPIVQVGSPPTSRKCSAKFWSPHLRPDIDKIKKIQRRATKMISAIRNYSYHQRTSSALYKEDCEDNELKCLNFEYLNRFTTASARGLFDYDLSDRTRNNGAKLIVKHFNTSVAQHFYPIKITTTLNALPNEVVYAAEQ